MSRAWPAAFAFVALLAFATLWQGAWANYAAQSSRPTTVMTINIERVINELEERKIRERELEQFITDLRTKVQAKDKELAAVQKEIELLPAGSEDRRRKVEDLRRRTFDLRFEGEYSAALIDERKGTVFAEIFRKIDESAARLAQQSGYDIVLSNDGVSDLPQTGPEQQIKSLIIQRRVIFASDAADMTDELIQMMNNEFRAGR